MENIFISIVNFSISATYIAAAVLLLRLVLKKVPKWISGILWVFVGLRLMFPFSLESIFSLLPSGQTIPENITVMPQPEIYSGIDFFNDRINPVISETLAPEVGASVNPMQVIVAVASLIWLVGIVAMLIYMLISYLKVRAKVREAVRVDGNIYECDNIQTAFILGVIKPKIYIPHGMSIRDMEFVIAHEKAHIKRLDHIWKPIGFLLLSVYWFNPVLWVAYILLCRDIELACDERVLKKLGTENKVEYSYALVNCSVRRRTISSCPLAFGEVGVKDRVKRILNYKKPAFGVVALALVVTLVTAVCFLTNPVEDKPIPDGLNAEIVTMLRKGGTAEEMLAEAKEKNFVVVEGTDKSSRITQGKEMLYAFSSTDDNIPDAGSVVLVNYKKDEDKTNGKITVAEIVFDGDKYLFNHYTSSETVNKSNLYSYFLILTYPDYENSPKMLCLSNDNSITFQKIFTSSTHDVEKYYRIMMISR